MIFDLRFSIDPETMTGLKGLLVQVQDVVSAPNHTRAQLNRVEAALETLMNQGDIMSKTLDDILSETTRQTTIEDSMEALLTGIKAQLVAAGLDQQKVETAFVAIAANNDRAAAALVANTPAAPDAQQA